MVPEYKAGDWVWLLRRNIQSARPSGKLDFKRLGPYRIDLPMGKDVYRLILPKELGRIHPVFHTSLLLPFIEPNSFPDRIGSKAPRGPSSLSTRFWDPTDIEAIMGYRSPSNGVHQYLVRWRGGSQADDSWERGGFFSPLIHPYLERFHEIYGTDPIILPPEKAVQVLL